MFRHININNIFDQCHFKGAQVPLKGWDPMFFNSIKGYNKEEEKRKIGTTKKKFYKLNCFNRSDKKSFS